MSYIYSKQEIQSLMERFDRDNISYDLQNFGSVLDAIMIKMDNRGSMMFIGSHRSYLIIDNPRVNGIDIQHVLIGNVVFNKNSLKKHFLLFSIKTNNEKIFDNYNDLATVYYQLDYEVKTYMADREVMMDPALEREETNVTE